MYKISIQVFIWVDLHKKIHSVLISSSRDIKLRTSSKLKFSIFKFSISLTFKVLYLSSRLSEWAEIFCANQPRSKLVLIFYTSWSNLAPVVFESHYKMYESTVRCMNLPVMTVTYIFGTKIFILKFMDICY